MVQSIPRSVLSLNKSYATLQRPCADSAEPQENCQGAPLLLAGPKWRGKKPTQQIGDRSETALAFVLEPDQALRSPGVRWQTWPSGYSWTQDTKKNPRKFPAGGSLRVLSDDRDQKLR
jgi:hypothetical protein